MARNTQKQLETAMKALMAKKNLDSITVQELSDAANVNKKTFYYHFQNMSDFLSWMYSAGFYSLMDAEGVTAENWPVHLKKVLAGIRKDHSYLSAIYASRYAPEFRQAISRMFDRAVEKYVKSSMKCWEEERGRPLSLSATGYAYLVNYHSMALFGMLEQWFQRGMQESDETFVRLIQMLSNDSLFNAFDQMNGRLQ